jgi:hypothetical protein
MIPVFSGSNLTSFMMLEASNPGEVITLPPVCLRALEWPYQTLVQTRRADVTTAAFQACILIFSAIAIFCQSIPHIGSALLMHIFAFAWSSSQVAATVAFRSDYRRLITGSNGACDGVDLLVEYFKNRLGYEIAMTAVDFVALFITAYLTWRLVLIYGWTSFKESNSSPIIQRAYVIVLALSTIIQLVAFFQITSIALWLDEITTHIMGATSKGEIAYLVLYIALALSIVPWIYLASHAIREESNRMMTGVFVFSVLYIAGFTGMLASDTFRQTVIHWSFFAAVFVIAWILLVIVIILAVLCQFNFGIGLHRYLDSSGTGSFRHTPDANGDIENGSTDFVVSFPDEKSLQREGSMSSNSSTLRSEHSYGYAKGILSRPALMAAEPGSIKILPPIPAALNVPRLNILRKYGKELWGRTRRHESTMSFGDMDASKLDHGLPAPSKARLQLPPGLGRPLTLEAKNLSRDGSPLTRTQPSQRVDSMGSVYSTNSNKPRLVLVTAL